MNSRNKILTRVKNALKNKSAKDEKLNSDDEILHNKIVSTIPKTQNELIEQFGSELENINADFTIVNNLDDVQQLVFNLFKKQEGINIATTNQTQCLEVKNKIEEVSNKIKFTISNNFNGEERKKILSEIDVSLIQADYGIAEIGSLVFCYDSSNTSYPHFLSDFIIVLLNVDKLLPNQFKLVDLLGPEELKNMVFVAGPSRTADIEKVLILGAHGPRKVMVLLITDKETKNKLI